MRTLVRTLWADERAATLIEYANVIALIAAVLIAVVWVFGRYARVLFEISARAVGNL